MEDQLGDNWCWAATGKSTSGFYDPESEFTQCSIANLLCEETTCCRNRPPCDIPKRLSDTLKATGNYVNHLQDIIEWREVRSEIEAERLVCARIEWTGGGGHFVAIYGVAQTESVQWLHIDDPLYGQSFLPYDEFVHNYHSAGSSWSHTYFTNVANAPRPA